MNLRRIVIAEVLLSDEVALIFAELVVEAVFIVRAEELGDAWVNPVLYIVVIECSLIRAVDVSEDELVA